MPVRRLFLLSLIPLITIVGTLQASLDFTLVDSIVLDQPMMYGVTQINDTLYVSAYNNRIVLFYVGPDGVSILDEEIICAAVPYGTKIQCFGSMLYVPTGDAGILVYQLQNPSLLPMYQIDLQDVAGYHQSIYLLKIIQNYMFIERSVSLDFSGSSTQLYSDVFDISDPLNPLHLCSQQLTGQNRWIVDILHHGGRYYYLSQTGAVYSTTNPAVFDPTNILPYYPEGNVVVFGLFLDDDLYQITLGMIGTELIKCSFSEENLLAVEWMNELPCGFPQSIRQLGNRIFICGIIGYPPPVTTCYATHREHTTGSSSFSANCSQQIFIKAGMSFWLSRGMK